MPEHTPMNDAASLGRLVSGIYDAAQDRSRWTAFLTDLMAPLKAGLGMIWLHDFSTGYMNLGDGDSNVAAVAGLDPATLSRFSDYYAARNVWLPNASQLAEGSIVVSSTLYPDARLKRTEFYDGLLRECDLFYGLGSSIVKHDSRDMKMSLVRSERAGSYDDAEPRLVQQLMPHLRNAVVLHRELARLQTLAASAMAALEMVPLGVIPLRSCGSMLHANRRAHELARATAALRFGPAGAVLASSPAATGLLKRLVGEASATGAGKGLKHGGALHLVGPNGRRLHILVTPLPADPSPFAAAASAAIFCSDPDAVPSVVTRELERLYGMTPAEARLTEALVNGHSLQQHADARCVTMNTVRTQLKAATAKAGATRQADLVRIVLTGPAVIGRG